MSLQTENKEKERIVIIGGGVIGASIAYHLSLRDDHAVHITVVERANIAVGASGKAGGFLARDWCDGEVLEPLARKSFDMHCELAKVLNGAEKYGFRLLDTYSITASSSNTSKSNPPLPWLNTSVTKSSKLGTTKTNGQVHPYLFTNTLIDAAKSKGVEVLIGNAQGLEMDKEKKKVTGVRVDGKVVQADKIVIAMGPWSGASSKWFSDIDIPVHGHRAHSIVLRPKTPISAHALFINLKKGSKNYDPEIYPRPTGEVYVCGEGDQEPLPEDPSSVVPNSDSCKRLKEFASILSDQLGEAEVEKEQACFLPISADGRTPYIGKLPKIEGAYIATGHSCWGILNSPATGLAMSELLLDGKSTSVDISSYDPAKLL